MEDQVHVGRPHTDTPNFDQLRDDRLVIQAAQTFQVQAAVGNARGQVAHVTGFGVGQAAGAQFLRIGGEHFHGGRKAGSRGEIAHPAGNGLARFDAELLVHDGAHERVVGWTEFVGHRLVGADFPDDAGQFPVDFLQMNQSFGVLGVAHVAFAV